MKQGCITIAELIKISGVNPVGENKSLEQVCFFLTDSRLLEHASETAFFARKGLRQDGHHFIPELYANGVRVFFTEEKIEHTAYPGSLLFQVKNCITTLQKLAVFYRQKLNCPVVGITGSNGKTVVKEWLFFLLNGTANVFRSPASYNSQLGVALSVLKTPFNIETAIFEAGISKRYEMDKLEKMIQPEIGVFINIGTAHDEGFQSTEEKVSEKLQLFRNCKSLIYCKDYPEIHRQVSMNQFLKEHAVSWSFSDKSTNLVKVKKQHNHTIINILFPSESFQFEIPFDDSASIENAIYCFFVLKALNQHNNPDVLKKFIHLPRLSMRLELKEGINGNTLINDSYNNDLTALQIALDFLKQQIAKNGFGVILSDLMESGQKPETLYPAIIRDLINRNISFFAGIGSGWTQFANTTTLEIPENYHFFTDTESLIRFKTLHDLSEKAILIKGSRVFEFERITALLQKQAHRTTLEIKLESIRHNLNVFQEKLPAQTKLMVMMKALGYGSGADEISLDLQWMGIQYLAVAYPDEGVALKKKGIQVPVMVMSPGPEALETMIRNRLEPEIYSFEILEHLEHQLKKLMAEGDTPTPYPIHIKLDTGMHRLGFLEHEIPNLADKLTNSGLFKIQSVFSHLAAASDDTKQSFTHAQAKLFEKMSAEIEKKLSYTFLRHLLNSPGIFRYPEYAFDMARIGIGLYGFDPDIKFAKLLKDVHVLKTTVLQVKQISKGSTISYGANHFTQEEKRIATIAIGYADGFNRKFGNGNWKVNIKGKLYPTIGDICMDMCMIDISGNYEISAGDEVIIFQSREEMLQMAISLSSIPYELLTSLSQRVKRVYSKD